MVTQKKFRILLIAYLIFFLLSGAIGLHHGITGKQQIDAASEKVSHESFVSESDQSYFFFLLAPLYWLIGMGILALQVLSLLALFMFWRFAPTLFLINVIVSEILFPILTSWFQNRTSLLTESTLVADTSKKVLLLEPIHGIMLILSGAILASIYLFNGKALFIRKADKKIY